MAFRISATSPAAALIVDKGAGPPAVSDHIAGNRRPVDGDPKWDLGAFEVTVDHRTGRRAPD